MMEKKVIEIFLASASPRRRELLEQIGIGFEVLQQNVDESILSAEAPRNYVLRLSQIKAAAGLELLKTENFRPVLGADTIVVCADRILGKPENQAHATEMLTFLSGKTHQVFTAVTLSNSVKKESVISTTSVQFRKITAQEIESYWYSGEPAGKAGAYAIQGLGALFVERIEGSYSGVVGLPLFETVGLLAQFGIGTMRILSGSVRS